VTIAVVFVPTGHVATYASQCLTYCEAKGYDVAGIVTSDWAAAVATVLNRAAGVIVVARADHLDPHREPRVEVAALPDQVRHRRTRIIRPGAVA
jgi:hypothetical protein